MRYVVLGILLVIPVFLKAAGWNHIICESENEELRLAQADLLKCLQAKETEKQTIDSLQTGDTCQDSYNYLVQKARYLSACRKRNDLLGR